MMYVAPFSMKLIYIFRINDEAHKGCLKIGETTLNSEKPALDFKPNCEELNAAARARINSYTATAGVDYDLLYTELTVFTLNKKIYSFKDTEVHNVLLRSGIKRKEFSKNANEWFITDLATAKKAIKAVKEGRSSLSASEITRDQSPIVFRPEQMEAIKKTEKHFRKNNRMLWNAKMRFGKTLSALQVIKDMDFTRTLILTHRPAVNDGWSEDFGKIFYDRDDFFYGSRTRGEFFASLEQKAKKNGHYVYFVSVQDLRGSERTGGKFSKNDEIFDAFWDLIIVDEAHEGIQTELGQNVLKELEKNNPKVLRLSGTPFNLLNEYGEDEIYTWDYVMEQDAKGKWDTTHPGDPNPYAALPEMRIYTFDLAKMLDAFKDEVLAFNFTEFFRVDTEGKFIHEKDIKYFLDLICKPDPESNYPFAMKKFRRYFRHSFWMLPGVREARALSALLQSHKVFGQFQIVNVAGEGDEDAENEEALQMVRRAIGEHPEETYTITLSCRRLTTGVSIPEWTAVFMLSGSHNTSAASYMQTIFRVQTPATINGRVKTLCFVFDFAPDRTLKVLAETAKISAKAGKTTSSDRDILGKFLNFCPVISVDGTNMKEFNANELLGELKKVYIDRVVNRGFEDRYLYNNDMLMTLNGFDLMEFDGLKEILKSTSPIRQSEDVEVNNQGFTHEEYEQLEQAEKKKKRKEELTEEEKRLLEEKKEKRKHRDIAISILRGISIRMPLMIYGAELDESQDVTIDNFSELVDEASWAEFMPDGVTKKLFNKFKKYYEPDIFREAGKRIRALAKSADKAPLEERIAQITAIFNTFHNPDKEKVLTPWRVVNMHMSDCLGGQTFYDSAFQTPQAKPRFVNQGKVTEDVFAPDSRILEINSKTGLYPLYMAYSIYCARQKAEDPFGLDRNPTLERQYALWDKVVAENIFIVCQTPMAKSITRRTLCGFRNAKVNAKYFKDLVSILKRTPQVFVDQVSSAKFWGQKGNGKMKFEAIVGNPPYQQMDGGGTGSSSVPIYSYFVLTAKALSPSYLSMIIPAKWFSGGKGLDSFRENMLSDTRTVKLVDFDDSRVCFPSVDIPGGVCYFLWDFQYSGSCEVISRSNDREFINRRKLGDYKIFIRNMGALSIIEKLNQKSPESLASVVYSRNPFGIPSSYVGSKICEKNSIELFGSNGVSYILKSRITSNKGLLKYFKVIMSKTSAEHAGQADKNGRKKIISVIRVLPPGAVCTESYLLLKTFEQEEDALNMVKYLKTQFVRFLLATILLTQNIAKDKFAFVPIQDFSDNSDIDWEKTVPEINLQLYKKYGLLAEEKSLIESSIKPMN